jgi:hypothetical protein
MPKELDIEVPEVVESQLSKFGLNHYEFIYFGIRCLEIMYQKEPFYTLDLNLRDGRYFTTTQAHTVSRRIRQIIKAGHLPFSRWVPADIDKLISQGPELRNAEYKKYFDKNKINLEILYILLVENKFDLRSIAETIQVNETIEKIMKDNAALWESSASPSEQYEQSIKLLEDFISQLIPLRNPNQETRLYLTHSTAFYYEHIETLNIRSRERADKLREIKYQILILFIQLELLLDSKSLYTVKSWPWSIFREFFVQEKYLFILQPIIFSGVKKCFENLYEFLKRDSFNEEEVRSILKGIIESDYGTYLRDLSISNHRNKDRKAKLDKLAVFSAERLAYIANSINALSSKRKIESEESAKRQKVEATLRPGGEQMQSEGTAEPGSSSTTGSIQITVSALNYKSTK